MPSSSPGRRRRVVAETDNSSSGTRSRSARISVPLPAPDGPVTTKTFELLPIEECNELRALALREAPDGLRLADAALIEEARGLHATELRHRHQHVEDLRRLHVVGRLVQDVLDVGVSELQVL